MDCFYAAIELRERPDLKGLPVAVGGRSGRGVLTTCNYEAREFGCHSAMPTFKALQKCPQLIMLPVNFDLYREVSSQVREIFHEFTDLVEPLSLDEAYLDVTHHETAAPAIAWEIRSRIRERTQLTASAGIAENKFLAKIASDWDKPDGQYEVRAEDVDAFVRALPIEKLWGVGKRTAAKMHALGLDNCGQLREWTLVELDRRFGKFGHVLYRLCRGIDERSVNPNRERKSVSNERTFGENLKHPDEGREKLGSLIEELIDDCGGRHETRKIREGFVKLKFEDFTITTAQKAMSAIEPNTFSELLDEAWARGGGKGVRLIGAGVRFVPMGKLEAESEDADASQLEMFGAA